MKMAFIKLIFACPLNNRSNSNTIPVNLTFSEAWDVLQMLDQEINDKIRDPLMTDMCWYPVGLTATVPFDTIQMFTTDMCTFFY